MQEGTKEGLRPSLLLSVPVLSACERRPALPGPALPRCVPHLSPSPRVTAPAWPSLQYSPGALGGGIYLKIFCGPDPLRTLRGRKIPGEDKKSTKHLLSELWSKRTGAEGRRALLALRRGCPEVSVTPALCLALCLCPRRHLSPPPAPPRVLGDGVPDYRSVGQRSSPIAPSSVWSHTCAARVPVGTSLSVCRHL